MNQALSIADRFQIDGICTRFERAWGQGRAPSVETFLSEVPDALRRPLLLELLACEIDLHEGQVETLRKNLDRVRVAVLERVNFDPAVGTTPNGEVAKSKDLSNPLPALPGYELLKEIGRGGMGVVYKAQDKDLRRMVAIKMVLTGDHATAEAIGRFRAEACSVAALHHPNIVQVYATGEHQGQPYQVLEFCEGGSLDQWLREGPLASHHAAELVLAVARAVAFAHAAGIVHRDLKPANVLLTSQGEPKVGDFGLARHLGLEKQTRSGVLVGTPSYMAPEQADGKSDIGPACDVWALGAVLYECLTGRPPFQADTIGKTLRQIAEVEPVPPRRLVPDVPCDLETVCLKCLEKEPARRYASAGQFADDLERFLADKPVEAKPVIGAVRLYRWGRRNPSLAALSGSLLLLLVIGLTVMVVLWQRAEARGELATKRQTLAREALAMYTRVANNFFRNTSLISKEEREALLLAQEKYLELLEEEDDPDQLHKSAFATLQLGDALHNIQEHSLAERATRRAMELLQKLSEDHPNKPNIRFDYSQGCSQFAGPLVALGHHEEAFQSQLEALRMGEELVTQFATNPRYKEALGSYQATVAKTYVERKAFDQAEPLFQAAVKNNRELLARSPHIPHRYGNLSFVVLLYADAVVEHRRDADAYLRLMGELVRLAEQTRAERKDWTVLIGPLLSGYRQTSKVQLDLGRTSDAIAAQQRYSVLLRERFERHPKDVEARREYAASLEQLAWYRWLENREQGAATFRHALEEFAKLDRDSGGLPAIRSQRAKLLFRVPDESQRDLPLALELAKDAAKADPGNPECRQTLGMVAFETGDYATARDELEVATARHTSKADWDGGPPFTLCHLAMTRWHFGDHDLARKLLKEGSTRAQRHAYYHLWADWEILVRAWRLIEKTDPPTRPSLRSPSARKSTP